MKKIKEIVSVPITKVVRDETQPRQHFDSVKLGRLADSIKKMGILEPIVVEALPDGTFKIVDGERRWRAAKSINLKEVPVLVEGTLSSSDRTIQQFHLQELREGWLPNEKAFAIKSLSDSLGISYAEAAKSVGIARESARAYEALMKLNEKELFVKHRLAIELAPFILGLAKTATTQYRNQKDEEIEEEKLIALEKSLVDRAIKGELQTNRDFLIVRDTFIKDINSLDKFIKGESSAVLFNKSKANVTRSYRMFKNAVNSLESTLGNVLKHKEAIEMVQENENLKKQIERQLIALKKVL